MQPAREMYLHDPTFHAMVDALEHALIRGDMTIETQRDYIESAITLAQEHYKEYLLREAARDEKAFLRYVKEFS